MLNINSLINGITSETNIHDYLLAFFTKKNFSNYEINKDANNKQIKAIKMMFCSKKDMLDRIEDVFETDPFCFEATFAYLMISEDVYIQLRFDSFLEEVNDYADFDDYQKHNYIKILDLFVDFLLDINNITKAISVQKLIVKLTNSFSKQSVSRLAYAYFSLENYEDFYKLFAETDFDAYEYILLIITLLKHDEKLKAQEVLLDMFDNVQYSTYLDHVWDLDENDEVQKEFSDIVQDCYDDISSIPTFFSWVNSIREKYAK